MALDAAQANAILTYLHGGGAPRALTGSQLRLMTVNGSAGSNGTPVAAGGGYVATGVALTWAAAAGQSQATSAIAQVTNYPRAETVVGIELWDNGGTPVRAEFGALAASKVMAAGDTLSFAAGAITSALA